MQSFVREMLKENLAAQLARGSKFQERCGESQHQGVLTCVTVLLTAASICCH
jgi:hypothetical protein